MADSFEIDRLGDVHEPRDFRAAVEHVAGVPAHVCISAGDRHTAHHFELSVSDCRVLAELLLGWARRIEDAAS